MKLYNKYEPARVIDSETKNNNRITDQCHRRYTNEY